MLYNTPTAHTHTRIINITMDVMKLEQTELRRLQRLEAVPMATEVALGYRRGGVFTLPEEVNEGSE